MLSFFGGMQQLAAQNAPGAPTKSMTVAEARQLNGVAEPTINGKPYSQYKAEQDALKKQNTAPQQLNNVSNTGLASAPASAPAKTTAPAPNRKPENGVAAPAVEASVVKAETPEKSTVVLASPSPKGTTAPKQMAADIPVNTKGTSQDPDASPAQAAVQSGGNETVTPKVVTEAKLVKTPVAEKAANTNVPAAAKGSSMDPDARPAMPAAEPAAPALPAQHSGNTAPAKTMEKPADKPVAGNSGGAQ